MTKILMMLNLCWNRQKKEKKKRKGRREEKKNKEDWDERQKKKKKKNAENGNIMLTELGLSAQLSRPCTSHTHTLWPGNIFSLFFLSS